jgi:hypothetical protein
MAFEKMHEGPHAPAARWLAAALMQPPTHDLIRCIKGKVTGDDKG